MNGTNYYFEIGPYLKKLREKKNMTRSELAEGICSVSHITRIENSDRCPSSVVLRQITQKLSITSEDLFRAIESPNSLYVKKILDQIFRYIERYDFKNIYELVTNEEENFDVLSIYDYQIIETVKHCSKAMLDKDYEFALNKIIEILELTYINKSTPTDIEFLLMSLYGVFLILSNQSEKAYSHLNNFKKHIDKIPFVHNYVVFTRFYVYFIVSCLDLSKLNEADLYIDYAIDYCKDYNTHIVLRELFFLKSELYYRLGNENEFKLWYDKSITFHELIKSSDNDYFINFINIRLKKLKII